jgi:fructose-specific phosphotransferase system IIA component
MKIMDFLCNEATLFELKPGDKQSILTEMVGALVKLGKVKKSDEVVDALLQREKLGSTGIGQGVAIPHCRCDAVKEHIAMLGISHPGIDFATLDGKPVNLVFLLLCPADANGQHLQIMARVSRLFKDRSFRQSLLEAKSSADVAAIINKADAQ